MRLGYLIVVIIFQEILREVEVLLIKIQRRPILPLEIRRVNILSHFELCVFFTAALVQLLVAPLSPFMLQGRSVSGNRCCEAARPARVVRGTDSREL